MANTNKDSIEYWRDLSEAHERRLKIILYELAGLVDNPLKVTEQDWLSALKNGKDEHARCLQRSWDAACNRTPNDGD